MQTLLKNTGIPLNIFHRTNQNDDDFIYKNWCREYLKLPTQITGMTGSHFLNKHDIYNRITRVLNRGANVIFSYYDADSLVGFICYELLGNFLVIHYAYVKLVFRGEGVYTEMLDYIFNNYPSLDRRNKIILSSLGNNFYHISKTGATYIKAPHFNKYVYLPKKIYYLEQEKG